MPGLFHRLKRLLRALTSFQRSAAGIAVAALALLAVYAIVLYGMPKGVFLTPDEGGKYMILHSMQWTADGLTYRLPYGGRRIDPEHRFYPSFGGHTPTFPYPVRTADGTIVFHWSIWFPLLGHFLYQRFGLAGIYVLPLASGWLIAVAGGWLAHRLRPGLGPLAVLLVGLGTPVFFYSLSFWEHTTATVLGLSAVVVCTLRRGLPSYVFGFALIAIAMLFRVELVVVAVALLLAVGGAELGATVRRVMSTDRSNVVRRGLQLVVSALVVISVVYLWPSIYEQQPPRIRGFLDRAPALLANLPKKLPHLPDGLMSVVINESANEGPAIESWWTAVALGAVVLCFVAPFLPRVYLEGSALLLGLSLMTAFTVRLLAGDGYRSVHGIFSVAPYGLLATYALSFAWRSREPVLLRLAAVTLIYFVLGVFGLFVSFVNPSGRMLTGLEWGQRYLLTLYPLLAVVALVVAADYWRSRRPRCFRIGALVLMVTAMGLAVCFEVRGLRMQQANLRTFDGWNRALRRGGPVLTDEWWFPSALADLFVTHEVFYVHDGKQMTEWAELANAKRVRRFQFAGRRAAAFDQPRVGEYRRTRRGSSRGLMFVTFALPRDSRQPRVPRNQQRRRGMNRRAQPTR